MNEHSSTAQRARRRKREKRPAKSGDPPKSPLLSARSYYLKIKIERDYCDDPSGSENVGKKDGTDVLNSEGRAAPAAINKRIWIKNKKNKIFVLLIENRPKWSRRFVDQSGDISEQLTGD